MTTKDTSQLATNLLGANAVERIFRDAANTANLSQIERENRFGTSTASTNSNNNNKDKDDDVLSVTSSAATHNNNQQQQTSGATAAAHSTMTIAKDARIAANRAANISVLMLGALAADAKIMEAPSNFNRSGNHSGKNNNNTLFGSIASNSIINADNVFSALNKAGFGHLVDSCKKAVLEDVDNSEETILGVRRQRVE